MSIAKTLRDKIAFELKYRIHGAQSSHNILKREAVSIKRSKLYDVIIYRFKDKSGIVNWLDTLEFNVIYNATN